jgi:hypothetical protein
MAVSSVKKIAISQLTFEKRKGILKYCCNMDVTEEKMEFSTGGGRFEQF